MTFTNILFGALTACGFLIAALCLTALVVVIGYVLFHYIVKQQCIVAIVLGIKNLKGACVQKLKPKVRSIFEKAFPDKSSYLTEVDAEAASEFIAVVGITFILSFTVGAIALAIMVLL